MKVYIAGPLCGEKERKFLEKIDNIVKNIGFETFLPHRDCGLYKDIRDIKKISERDIKEIRNCDLVIGILNGICIGAGTAWEMGFAEAMGKKVLGLKTDRKVNESIADISAVIAGKVEIIESVEELKKKLKELNDSA